jgi:hypothetical protein
MVIKRRHLLGAGMVGLASLIAKRSSLRALSLEPAYFTAGAFYRNDFSKWLYIGWEIDHPKSWTFMGGAVSPGLRLTIQFAVTVNGTTYYPDELAPDRKQKIHWYLREGFLPVPVSEWTAGPVQVTILHFTDRVRNGTASAVYSRVELRTSSAVEMPVRLEIGATQEIGENHDCAVPLTGKPDHSGKGRMAYDIALVSGQTATRDFVSLANGEATSAQLVAEGSLDKHYMAMKEHWVGEIESLAHPVTLPNPTLVNMYKALQIVVRENTVAVGADCEIHAGPSAPTKVFSYDQSFTHDVSNCADQLMREGDYSLAKKLVDSGYYKNLNQPGFSGWSGLDGDNGEPNYVDTIGKYLLPFAEYLRATGDLAYFTPARRADMTKAARNIHAARVFTDPEHYGLMRKSQDFENWANGGDYLLCDNWGALHGLQAYKYVCGVLGDSTEAQWASDEMSNLNECLNKAIEKGCEENGRTYYLGAFDKSSHLRYEASDYSWVPYSGALSTFPWGAYLKGFSLAGAWKDKFDASIEYALQQRDDKGIPEGSWGAWWGQVTFGSTYNASAGLQCLFSDKYRTEAIKNVEFLARHQCAPFQWSEAFEFKGVDQWAGMYTPPTPYGNYECWGCSLIKQTLLQACVSVKTDGTVIIGRGVPDHWISSGSVIEWANINVNNDKRIDFRIGIAEQSVELKISGDIPIGEILLDLPILRNNILSASAGTVDAGKGTITLPHDTRDVVVQLHSRLSRPE